MTIRDAINALQTIQAKHGADVPVYFDCPHCNQSFTPGYLATKAVHLTLAVDDDPHKPGAGR